VLLVLFPVRTRPKNKKHNDTYSNYYYYVIINEHHQQIERGREGGREGGQM
jgi:uncharacterized membrane protein